MSPEPLSQERLDHLLSGGVVKKPPPPPPCYRRTFNDLLIAPSRCQFVPGWDGFYTSTGKVYLLCPYHEENTPSCVFKRDRNWFHCHGCGKMGKGTKMVRHLIEKLNRKEKT